jgi:hypothetical protein
MKRIQRILFVLAVVVAAGLRAESPSSSLAFKSAESFQPGGFLSTLLDPSRWSMSQQYSVSFLSNGKQGFSQGLYLNTIRFRLSDPLSMEVRLGAVHGLGMEKNRSGVGFLQGATLQYRPSENTTFTVDVQSVPSSVWGLGYRGW